jgi:hypothetical protein
LTPCIDESLPQICGFLHFSSVGFRIHKINFFYSSTFLSHFNHPVKAIICLQVPWKSIWSLYYFTNVVEIYVLACRDAFTTLFLIFGGCSLSSMPLFPMCQGLHWGSPRIQQNPQLKCCHLAKNSLTIFSSSQYALLTYAMNMSKINRKIMKPGK